MTYPDAERYIPAPLSLLTGWCGPVEWSANPGPWRRGVWGYIGESSGAPVEGLATAGDGHDRGYMYRLDPARPEVRDHLARRLRLPHWPDGPVQAAAMVACSAARVAAGLQPVTYVFLQSIRLDDESRADLVRRGDAVIHPDGILLPYPDGVKLWRLA